MKRASALLVMHPSRMDGRLETYDSNACAYYRKKILVSPGRHTRMILLVVVLLLLGWIGGHVECSAVAWETLELEGYSMNRT